MPFFVLDVLRRIAFVSCLAALLVFPAVARAQSNPQPAQPAPLPPPAPPSPPPAPLPVPQTPIVTGPYTCFVAEHAGIDDADARTTTDLVCSELGLVNATPGTYDVRFGKL